MTRTSQFKPEHYPTLPGVYLMRGEDGVILYVGKARNLRSRLRSYLRPEHDSRPQIRFLMERAATIETIVTDTEKEALILENTLIKEHRPRYNIHLRDDKTYVSLRLDPREPFPSLRLVRKVAPDGALYFGPYASSTSVKETLKQLYRIFPLRRLATEVCSRRQRPCLYYQIGQCSGPCHDKISREDYAELVRGAIDLLSGRQEQVLRQLQAQMRVAANEMRFELAAQLRDRIAAITATVERQKVVTHGGGNCDVFGLWGDGREYEIVILSIRNGHLLGSRSYRLHTVLEACEILSTAVTQFYDLNPEIPPLLLLPLPLEDAPILGEWLAERRGGPVRLFAPQRGDRRELIELAQRNARELFVTAAKKETSHEVLQEIANRLGLRQLPKRMECFDISNLQGAEVVGSMVVFIDAKPARQAYRRYEVTSLDGQADDYASLYEVLGRRLDRAIRDNVFPELILVDGGRGQLGVLSGLIAERGLTGQTEIAAIAKARQGQGVGKDALRTQERFFRPGREAPILFPPGSAALRVLQHLRDEAHRFALNYHRRKRKTALLHSQLEEIPGIGPKRRLALLRHFGSLRQMRQATVEELASVQRIGMKAASLLYAELHVARRVNSEDK